MYIYVKFKSTMTKWCVQKHVGHQDARAIQKANTLTDMFDGRLRCRT